MELLVVVALLSAAVVPQKLLSLESLLTKELIYAIGSKIILIEYLEYWLNWQMLLMYAVIANANGQKKSRGRSLYIVKYYYIIMKLLQKKTWEFS